jgi:glycosyltransferase involved in cell wall biosynthesis
MIEFAHMNILFFSRLFYPHVGGVEKHVLKISQLLIEKGHRVTVVTEQDSSKTKQSEIFEGIEIFRIPRLKDGKLKKFKIWKWLWNSRRLMKDADIIHCHDVFFWYLPFRFLFPFKKVFTTFHGYEGYPLKSMDIFMHKVSERLSMGNICIGDFIKKWYGTSPTYTAYGGVGISNSQFPISNKIRNKNSALFIGRLDEQTGILTYIKAIKIIKKKNPNFDFLIIGDGKLRNEISEKIKILKPLNNASEHFQKYNFAFGSGYLSMMEAMAVKRLVFAVYDNPLKEDYLRMAPFTKYITISGNAQELVPKIFFYLDNPKEKEKLVEKAYEWVEKHTWGEMANTYLKLWKL